MEMVLLTLVTMTQTSISSSYIVEFTANFIDDYVVRHVGRGL